MSTSIHPMYINGAWRQGSEGDVADDINPATGEVFARIAQASAQDVEDALAAADGARHAWQKMLANEREALLHKAAEIIGSQADQIRDLLIEETGSVFMKAPWEVSYILKPSDLAPLSGLKIAEIFAAAGLPPGVLNVIPGPAAMLGDKLISDPRVKMITFTGSSKVGRYLAAEAGKHMKRVTLEMGGKNPLVVLKDADLDYAVNAAAFGIFFHQGQVCMASSRIIVEAPLYDSFLAKFVAKARTIKVGDPRDPTTVIGPLIRESQCDFIAGQIDDAVSKGAAVCCGGRHRGPYFDATVLGGVTAAMSVYGDESFGPVTSVLRADDYEHALFLANDTRAGLSSAVVTNDLQKAFDFALRSESGMVHINDTTISDEPHIDFGGVKESGFGREGGMASIAEMTEVKWVTFQMGKREFPF